MHNIKCERKTVIINHYFKKKIWKNYSFFSSLDKTLSHLSTEFDFFLRNSSHKGMKQQQKKNYHSHWKNYTILSVGSQRFKKLNRNKRTYITVTKIREYSDALTSECYSDTVTKAFTVKLIPYLRHSKLHWYHDQGITVTLIPWPRYSRLRWYRDEDIHGYIDTVSKTFMVTLIPWPRH